MTRDELAAAVAALAAGKVVAAATETWFGLLADARQADAIDRVLSLKGRAAEKGIAVLLPNPEAWASLVDEISELGSLLAERFWPGPLTIALPARAGLDSRLVVDGTVGARWGRPSDARRIAEVFGAPVTATSANMSGRPSLATSEEVATMFSAPIAASKLMVVSGDAPGGPPSTLVVVRGGRVRLLRPGAVSRDELARVLPREVLE
jgi:L-threonylcarbamoyladenylate synthase